MSDAWIEELLDTGVGALAVKHLYRMKRGITNPRACPACGYRLKKWGVVCPECRKPVR